MIKSPHECFLNVNCTNVAGKVSISASNVWVIYTAVRVESQEINRRILNASTQETIDKIITQWIVSFYHL